MSSAPDPATEREPATRPAPGQLTFTAPRRGKPPRHLADLDPAERRAVADTVLDILGDARFGPLHDEASPVTLLHEYARTKFAGESFALTAPRALVLRTNILGASKGFARFSIDALKAGNGVFFDDFYTSPLHVDVFAKAALDLAQAKATGIVNLGARGAASKAELARGLAMRLGLDFSKAQTGSVAALSPRRAESLGLDVRKAESILKYQLPGWEQSLDAVALEAR